MQLSTNYIEQIKQLCQQYNVASLYAFGSVVTNNLKIDSDVDLLVRFYNIEIAKYFDNYNSLKLGLENVLGRKVDLLEEQALKNPILIRSINKNKELIYG